MNNSLVYKREEVSNYGNKILSPSEVNKDRAPLGASYDNDYVIYENELYEWNFSTKYKPSAESIKFWAWEREFFTNESPTPPFHYFITDNLYRKGFQKHSIECYRGGAKSTVINTKSLLYWIYYGEYPNHGDIGYVYIASATLELVKGHLEAIYETIVQTPKLNAVLKIEKRRQDSNPRLDIRSLKTGKLSIVEGKSPDQQSRGKRAGKGDRVDLLILDDSESEESVATTESRSRYKDWYTRVMLPSVKKIKGRGAKIIAIGTPLHQDSSLASFTMDEDTTSIRVRACKEFNPEIPCPDSDCAWASMYDYASILADYKAMKSQSKVLSFWTEIMLQLKADSSAVFDTSKLRYFDPYGKDTENLTMFLSLDASTGAVNGDESSFIVVGVDHGGNWYIFHMESGRHSVITIVDKIFELVTTYDCRVVMESGVIYNMIMPLIHAKMASESYTTIVDVIPISRNSVKATGRAGRGFGKLNVIKMLSPRFNLGKIYAPDSVKYKKDVGKLIAQAEGITQGAIISKHDDVIDSLAQLELCETVTYCEYGYSEIVDVDYDDFNSDRYLLT